MKMKNEKKKLNLHMVSNEDGLYFWDRIDAEKLQKCIVCATIVFICLPLIASLTVRPWIYMLKGWDAARNCDYMVMNQWWSSLVYCMGTILGMLMILKMLQRYSVHSLVCLRDRKWILSHWLSLNMFLLLLWSTVSFFLAKDRKFALWGDYYCHEGLLLFYIYAVLFMLGSWFSSKQMKLTVEILVGICAFMSVLAVNKKELLSVIFYIESEESSVFHNRNHLGYFLSICAPLAIGLALQDETKSKFLKAGRIVELWLVFNALIACNTRGSFIAVILVMIFWNIYVFLLKKDLKKRILAIDGLLIITFVALNTGNDILNRFSELWEDIENIYQGQDKEAALNDFGTSRGVLWRYGIQFAMEKPLFGYGPGNLIEPYMNANCIYLSPHNDLILIGASLGLPAVVFYISGLAAHLKGFFHFANKMSIFQAALYAAIAGYLLNSMLGASIYCITPYYFLMLGFTYGVYKQYSREETALNQQSIVEKDAETEQVFVSE